MSRVRYCRVGGFVLCGVQMVFATSAAAVPCRYPSRTELSPQDGATIPTNAVLRAFNAVGNYTLSVAGGAPQPASFRFGAPFSLQEGDLPGLIEGSIASVVVETRGAGSSVEMSWNVSGVDSTAPSAPGMLEVLYTTYTSSFNNKACSGVGFTVEMQFPDAVDDIGVAGYQTYWRDANGALLVSIDLDSASSTTGFVRVNYGVPGRNCYTVRAIDYAGHEGAPSPELCIELALPDAPDAGTMLDASGPADVVLPQDAGSAATAEAGTPDALGLPGDAADVDAGLPHLDAAANADSGLRDAGSVSEPTASGCGCATGTARVGTASFVWGLLGLLLLRRAGTRVARTSARS